MPDRFPKPWRIEELAVAWMVVDANGVPLSYHYWAQEGLIGTSQERPSKAQALVLARAFARLGRE